MAYEVIILGEAEQFIRRLDVKMRAKTARSIGLLRQFGYRLPMPHARKLHCYPLHEIRVKQGSNIVRLFYFVHDDEVCIVTSGYVKKSDKTSTTEIERAMRLRTAFIKELSNGS